MPLVPLWFKSLSLLLKFNYSLLILRKRAGFLAATEKKRKKGRSLKFLLGYSAGFFCWMGGLHCFEADSQGVIHLSRAKLLRHLTKVFLWALELTLLYHLVGLYFNWLLQASGPEKAMAFLIKSVIFLYVKVFWPKIFPEILPGLHVFFCPQCYRRQTFKFLPVSFRYGFFVTYLCQYCACLVDGWGKQIFYPSSVTFKQQAPFLFKTLFPVLAVLALGVTGFEVFWRNF